MRTQTSKKLITAATIVILIAMIFLSIKFYQLGYFQDPKKLQSFMKGKGIFAPAIFIFIQIIQVVIPIIPGGVSTAAGVLMFGPLWGFIYNYLGIVLGSLILFFLGRHYGRAFVVHFVSQEMHNKYLSKLENQKRWDTFFALMIFFPFAPDDVLVLISSLTEMTYKKFTWIILLGKPASIAVYSLALVYGAEWLTRFLGQ